jgi:hypothetical protein
MATTEQLARTEPTGPAQDRSHPNASAEPSAGEVAGCFKRSTAVPALLGVKHALEHRRRRRPFMEPRSLLHREPKTNFGAHRFLAGI